MRLVNFGDRVRELAAPPIFLAMDLALGAFDEAAIPLEHRGHLLTLVRVDQKHDFVVSQQTPLGFKASRRAVRQGVKPRLSGSGGGACYSLRPGGSTGCTFGRAGTARRRGAVGPLGEV